MSHHLLVICLALLIWQLCPLQAASDPKDSSMQGVVPDPNTDLATRCALSKGSWCKDFHAQAPVPFKPAPRGSKACPSNCSNIGVCHLGNGMCYCPAGREGPSCSKIDKRPCYNMGKDRRDRDFNVPDWYITRCAGICEDNLATCWCDKGKYGAVLNDPKADPLAPFPKMGRPLVECQASTFPNGTATTWGGPDGMTYEAMYGERGWCVADEPPVNARCACRVDGLAGPYCNMTIEHMCPNQCSGHGSCHQGFCKCYSGWYGHDCAQRQAGLDMEPGDEETRKPHIRHQVVQPLGAQPQAPSLGASRQRPLIYVYDLPPLYNARIMQYRGDRFMCAWRGYEQNNGFTPTDWTYASEQYLHEAMLQSPHRTFDPEEADFFYMPVYSSCMVHPVAGSAERPAFPILGGQRVMHGTFMLMESKAWVQQHYPYWNRTGGKDHIFTLTHDEGACWAPNEIINSTILTHWGRMDNNTSETGFGPDDFSFDYKTEGPPLPDGWVKHIRWHTCYDPRRHLAIPAWKRATHYIHSPLVSSAPSPRDLLLFFRGDVGIHHGDGKKYSRGIRQELYRRYKKYNWEKKYRVIISYREEHKGFYSDFLKRSRFCLAPPGDGWSPRVEDSVLHGCIPVLIMDNVHGVFESLLDYTQFSVRVAQADIAKLPAILQAIPASKVLEMQVALARVWHRFAYRAHQEEKIAVRDMVARNKEVAQDQARRAKGKPGGKPGGQQSLKRAMALQPPPFRGNLTEADDAWATIMQWLHSRIPYVKGLKQEEPHMPPRPVPVDASHVAAAQ